MGCLGTDVGNPDRMLSCYFILHLCISGVTKVIAAEEVVCVCLTSKCNNKVIALHLNSHISSVCPELLHLMVGPVNIFYEVVLHCLSIFLRWCVKKIILFK